MIKKRPCPGTTVHEGPEAWVYCTCSVLGRGVFLSARYRGTSLIRNRLPLGPYSKPMSRALRWSQRAGGYLELSQSRGTSLIRNRLPLGPYSRHMPRVPGGSWGGGNFS